GKSGLDPLQKGFPRRTRRLHRKGTTATHAVNGAPTKTYRNPTFRLCYKPMTSSDIDRLTTLYREIDRRLEHGETSSPEMADLLAEVHQLQSGEDAWINFDPKGISLPRQPSANQDDETSPNSASGWR